MENTSNGPCTSDVTHQESLAETTENCGGDERVSNDLQNNIELIVSNAYSIANVIKTYLMVLFPLTILKSCTIYQQDRTQWGWLGYQRTSPTHTSKLTLFGVLWHFLLNFSDVLHYPVRCKCHFTVSASIPPEINNPALWYGHVAIQYFRRTQ